jgi:acetolactate synthase-1/2/3 large subunit
MMNIQELASISRNAPQIKIILLNNQGYGMVRQTEDQWLESKHVGTDSRVGDITFPDFKKLAESFGLKPLVARNKVELTNALVQMYANKTSSFLEVCLNPESKVTPQVRFGSPLEDSEPRLSHEELKSNMLIPLIDNDRE